MRRNVVDFLVALTMATLLITPIRPAGLRSELTPPSGEPINPLGTSVAAGQTVGSDRLLDAQDESPGRSTQSTEPVPKADPKAIAPPDDGTPSPRQTKVSPVTPRVISATRTVPPRAASSNPNDPSYVVRVGPISAGNGAEIIRQLEAAHYSPRMGDRQIEPQRFRVVSAPMRRSAAGQLASTLAQKDFPSLMRALPDDQVEVQFGVFSTQAYAEDLVNRIQRQGYTPAVVREGEVRIITVGPASGAAVKVIVKVIESTMSYHSLTMVPCGSKDPWIHAWRGWVQVCQVSSRGARMR
jgi:hypothetical protein